MTRRRYNNNAPTALLSSDFNASTPLISVGSLTGFPTQFPYTATLELNTANAEVVQVIGAAANTVTCQRGYDGTSGKSHAMGSTFDHTAIAKDYDEANDHVNAVANVHGVVGNLVGTDTVQTLKNKTLVQSQAMSSGGSPAWRVVAGDGSTAHLIDALNDAGDYAMWMDKDGKAMFAALNARGDTWVFLASGDQFHIDGAGTGNFVVDWAGRTTITGNAVQRGDGPLFNLVNSAGSSLYMIAGGFQIKADDSIVTSSIDITGNGSVRQIDGTGFHVNSDGSMSFPNQNRLIVYNKIGANTDWIGEGGSGPVSGLTVTGALLSGHTYKIEANCSIIGNTNGHTCRTRLANESTGTYLQDRMVRVDFDDDGYTYGSYMSWIFDNGVSSNRQFSVHFDSQAAGASFSLLSGSSIAVYDLGTTI
jgi:hypothetical protein